MTRPDNQEILDSIAFTIGDTFSTTVDGSQERADFLGRLALTKVKDGLKDRGIGWLASRRYLRFARTEIEREMKQVLS